MDSRSTRPSQPREGEDTAYCGKYLSIYLLLSTFYLLAAHSSELSRYYLSRLAAFGAVWPMPYLACTHRRAHSLQARRHQLYLAACASMIWQPVVSLSLRASRAQLRQTMSNHSVQSLVVRSYASAAATAYPECRDIASILDSPRNTDPTPRPVQIVAHVQTVRAQRRRAFVALNDGSTARPLQVLLDPAQAIGYVYLATSLRVQTVRVLVWEAVQAVIEGTG